MLRIGRQAALLRQDRRSPWGVTCWTVNYLNWGKREVRFAVQAKQVTLLGLPARGEASGGTSRATGWCDRRSAERSAAEDACGDRSIAGHARNRAGTGGDRRGRPGEVTRFPKTRHLPFQGPVFSSPYKNSTHDPQMDPFCKFPRAWRVVAESEKQAKLSHRFPRNAKKLRGSGPVRSRSRRLGHQTSDIQSLLFGIQFVGCASSRDTGRLSLVANYTHSSTPVGGRTESVGRSAVARNQRQAS
jgi:hypothetical protein